MDYRKQLGNPTRGPVAASDSTTHVASQDIFLGIACRRELVEPGIRDTNQGD